MDTYKYRYLELESRWEEYSKLQEQLRKDRRIILLCACVVCLLIGYMAGMILDYPKGHVVVTMEVPVNESASKSELNSRLLQYSAPLDRGSVGQFSPWRQRSRGMLLSAKRKKA